MSTNTSPRVNQPFVINIIMKTSTGNILATPTIATGDIHAQFGTASELVNGTNFTATVVGPQVRLSFTGAQHTHHDVVVWWIDQTATKEWMDHWIFFRTDPAYKIKSDATKEFLTDGSDTVILEAGHSEAAGLTTREVFVEP